MIENTHKEWCGGEIFYPSGDSFVTLKLERIFPGEGEKANPEFIYFKLISEKDEYKHQINFFTIKLANKPITKRYQLVVSTSSLTFDQLDSNKKTVLQFCILREINFNEINSELKSDTDEWIIKKLKNKRLLWPSDGTLFTTKERFDEVVLKKNKNKTNN